MKGNMVLLFLVFWPMIGAILSYIIGRSNKKARDFFAILVTIVEFLAVISLYGSASNEAPATFEWLGFGGSRLYLLLDGFRYIYALIAAFMWMMTTAFSREYFAHYRNRNRYYLFTLMTLGATMAVLLSADLLTTFIFFEVMSFTSYVMVIHDEKLKAQSAAKTYMVVSVLIGLVMLMGIFLLQYNLGTTEIALLLPRIKEYNGNMNIIYVSAILMMVGFGGKAGMFPLHIWLPNAHPAAPAPASALLSGILTKTGIFGALVISSNLFLYDAKWGLGMLIFGLITMFLGAFLALFSIDLKRTLALSSVSQIGFIIVGIAMQGILGEHNALAVRGTFLHMINHSLIKLVLFMAAGIIYMNLHELDLNKVRGFGKGKPLLTFIFGMGVLSIIGMPFWSGYVSKTLLHESIVEQIWLFEDYSSMSTFYQIVESIFTLTGGLTAAYMTKLFVAIFVEKNPYDQDKHDSYNKKYMNSLSTVALLVPALILPILGMRPQIMDSIAKFGQYFMHGHDPAHEVHYFAWINLKGAVASLTIGAIVYFLIIRGLFMEKDENDNLVYINAWPNVLNIEKLIYEPLLGHILPFIGAFFARTIGSLITVIGSQGYKAFKLLEEVVYRPLKSDDENSDNAGFEKILSSSVSYSLIQFTVGLVLVSLVVIIIQNI